jgi:hypothetical protein
VVKKIFLSAAMASDKALMDLSLPTKTDVVIKGNNTMSLNGTKGSCFFTPSGPSWEKNLDILIIKFKTR